MEWLIVKNGKIRLKTKFVMFELMDVLIPENRKHSDDLLNLTQKKNKIDPQAPTGLVPPPTTTDNNSFVDS